VVRDVVVVGPKPLVGRHGEEHVAAWLHDAMDLAQCAPLVGDVFEAVKQRDEVIRGVRER
jgi:hypothetical protein